MTQEQIANSYQDALKIIKDRRVELCNGIEVVYQKLVRITNYLDRQAAAELAESLN